MGKTIRRRFIRNWMGEDTELGMYVRSSKTWIILIGICGWPWNGWKQTEYGSHVEEIDEKRWSWRTNFISWPYVFEMYSTWMQTKWNDYWTLWEDVGITYFCLSNWKFLGLEKPHAQTVALSYDQEGHSQKMCGAILWVSKQDDSITL